MVTSKEDLLKGPFLFMDKEKIKESIEAEVCLMGYELIDFKYNPIKNGTLRIDIDSVKGIDINDCEVVSKRIDVLLDVINPNMQSYNLEVSSPGPRRKLLKKQHFISHISFKIKIKYRNTNNDVVTLKGILIDANEEVVKINMESKVFEVNYKEIIDANLNM